MDKQIVVVTGANLGIGDEIVRQLGGRVSRVIFTARSPQSGQAAAAGMLASAFSGNGIAVNSVCPGWVKTDLGGPGAEREVSQGADSPVRLALDAPQSLTGKFIRDRKVIPWQANCLLTINHKPKKS